ncbi:MAG TPA: sialate O-acetylesterase [Flavobacterium sp.]|nr:sialate O-acetylesterase [Flavobacterium sp.]
MKKAIVLFIVFITQINSILATDFKLAAIFSDNMVLQREKKVLFWGDGKSNEEVILHLDKKTFKCKVSPDGKWKISIPALKLGKTYHFKFNSEGKEISLSNVVAGDVWLCSGQSNMEFQINNFPWATAEVTAATNQNIRYYYVPDEVDLVERDDFVKAGVWKIATGKDILQFSATAYFFAKNLQPEIGVPVGIISSDLSGTSIEPWMSKEALKPFPQFKKTVEELEANKKTKKQIETEFAELRKTWDKEYYFKGKGIDEKWYLPTTDFSDWKPTKPSTGYWEDSNIGLENFDGAVWYKTTFDLPENFNQEKFHLDLNHVKDYSTTWVNGKIVGETFGNNNWCDYYVDVSLLQKKGNVIIVRILNIEGKGGFNFHPFWGTPILNGNWVYKADIPFDKTTFVVPNIVNVSPFSNPTILYNSMISPIKEMPIKGVIWYQGESNAGRAEEYNTLFPAMINDWRNKFKNPELPFYFVQLANYDIIDKSGNKSDWAELREAQAKALQLPNTGMITAIDLGDDNDIHPKNKQDVGYRLSLLALEKSYKKIKGFGYPVISKIEIRDQNQVEVFIDTPSSMVIPEDAILGFSLAGEDNIFHQAKANYVNGKLFVSADEVKNPKALRYGWAKNPGKLNLYNANKLPLRPYRSDDFKGVTNGRVYDPNIIYF